MLYTHTLIMAIHDIEDIMIYAEDRETHERPSDRAHWDYLKPLVEGASVPILANGDIFTHADIDAIRSRTGCRSVLIARGALRNASIFRKDGPLPVNEVDAFSKYLYNIRIP